VSAEPVGLNPVTAVTLEDLVRPLLEMLTLVLGQESAYLTIIDSRAGVQQVLLARNTANLAIPEDIVVPWEDTLCKRALEQGSMVVDNVPACWGDSVAARDLGIVTYVSAPILIGEGELYGTLCAASTTRRPISDDGAQALRLCAGMIGRHIERERAQRRSASETAATLQGMESRLALQHRRLDAVLDNATVSIILMDEHQHCVYMNPAAERLTGYTLADTTGRPLHDVVHHTRPDGLPYPLEECPIDRAFPQNNHEQGEETFVHRDGSFYPVAFTASPIRDDTAQVVGTVVELRDIRRQKAVLDALSEANQAKDQFLAMLGHELRNPLAPITTSLHLLRLKGIAEREVEIIERQVGQLTRLVDDLLDVSRVTRGQLALQMAPVELQEVVARGIETARPLLERSRSELQVEVPAIGLLVEADATRLSQVVSNLLNNAAKFSAAGSRIRVRGWQDGGRVRLSIADEGSGVPPELRQRIFEPFVQGTQGRDRALGGLGLGLSIAHSLVRLHHGELTLTDEHGAPGSEFVIDLPRADRPLASPSTHGERAQRTISSPRRVLIVDDNRDAADSLCSTLLALGHEARAVYDAASAISLSEGFAPDVAILDIGLPVMDGYELAARIRARFAAVKSPRLIALTGYGLPSDRTRSAAAGFSDHLLKPVDVDRLLDAIDTSA
jgi:PAS domain S-box-containing protein